MLEIAAEPPTFQKPGTRALAPPPARQDLEGSVVSFFDDLDGRSSRLLGPFGKGLSPVPAVDPQVGEPRKILFSLFEEPLSSLAVSDIGRGHDHLDGQAFGVDHQMPLSADQPLGSVEPALPAGFRRSDRLAVENRGAGGFSSALFFAPALVEGVVAPLEGTVETPPVEVGVDRVPVRGKVSGQVSPLASVFQHVEDSVDHLPHVGRTPVASRAGRRDQGSDQGPLLVGKV